MALASIAAIVLAIGTITRIQPIYAIGGPVFIANEVANGRSAIGYCADQNNTAYIAWVGTDSGHSLNFGWPLPGNNTDFAFKTTINDSSLHSPPNPNLAPALACFNNGSGLHLWVAYVGTDNNIHVGWFDGMEPDRYLHQEGSISETSYSSPGLTNFNGMLWVSWRGAGNNCLNVKGSPTGYIWSGTGVQKATFTSDTASGGVGVAPYTATNGGPSGLWLSWPERDSATNPHLNVAHANVGSQTLDTKTILTNTTPAGFDATLAATNVTDWIYLPETNYSSNLANVVESQNATQWGTVQLSPAAYGGVSGAIQYINNSLLSLSGADFSGHMWYITDYNFAPQHDSVQ